MQCTFFKSEIKYFSFSTFNIIRIMNGIVCPTGLLFHIKIVLLLRAFNVYTQLVEHHSKALFI
jgi:hypothetical protein